MTRLSELLDSAVGDVEPAFATKDVFELAARRRRVRVRVRRAAAAIGAATLAAVVVVVVIAHGGGTPRVQVVKPTPTSAPAVTTPDDVLLLDETGGIAAVDPASRTVTRDPIAGWRPGDQPYLTWLVDGHVVAGWGDVYATPTAGGAARRLGTGVFVPAAEPGAVWLTSYGQVQTTTERLVDMQGRVLESGKVPSQVALVGVPGGLAFQTSTGLDIWDAHAGSITRHLGTTSAMAAPPFGSLLPWCDQCDHALELTDLATGATREVAVPLDGGLDTINRAAFSPDGTKLAIVSTTPANDTGNGTASVVVIDVATATISARFDTGHRYATIAWSLDGDRLYVAASEGGGAGELFAYEPVTNMAHDLGREPAGAGNITGVIPYGAAAGLLSEHKKPGTETACPAPVVASDNSTRRCSYRY